MAWRIQTSQKNMESKIKSKLSYKRNYKFFRKNVEQQKNIDWKSIFFCILIIKKVWMLNPYLYTLKHIDYYFNPAIADSSAIHFSWSLNVTQPSEIIKNIFCISLTIPLSRYLLKSSDTLI